MPVNTGVLEQVQTDTLLATASGLETASSTSRNKGQATTDKVQQVTKLLCFILCDLHWSR